MLRAMCEDAYQDKGFSRLRKAQLFEMLHPHRLDRARMRRNEYGPKIHLEYMLSANILEYLG